MTYNAIRKASAYLSLAGALLLDLGSVGAAELETVASFATDRPIAVAVSATGRKFVNLPYSDFSTAAHGHTVVEVMGDQSAQPFPTAEWNQKPAGDDPARRFFNVQSLTIDAADRLWVLDTGSPRRAGVVEGGAKLVEIDLARNEVLRTVVLGAPAVVRNSYLNDLRIDADRQVAYVTDSVRGGILIVDLRSGNVRVTLRVMPNDERRRALIVEGVSLAAPGGGPQALATDGVALDRRGEWLYFMNRPLSGSKRVYRVATVHLRNADLSEADVQQHVQLYVEGVMSDGIEVDDDGYVYFTDLERNALSRRRPGESLQIVVQDARLQWPDALAFDRAGNLYVTVAQFHLLPGFNGGNDRSSPPYRVFKVPAPLGRAPGSTDTLKPQTQALLERMAAQPAQKLSVANERAALAALSNLQTTPERVHSVTEKLIPGPGGSLAVRIYKPSAADTLPVLVWFHSGSWVKGGLDLEDVQLRAIANRSGWMIVSVDYRLAPEDRFPAATNDAWAATQWVKANAGALGAEANRVAVGGNSAGGNLAATVALRARDEKALGLVGVVLVNPALDLTLSSRSWTEFGSRDYVVGAREMRFNIEQYLGPGNDPRSERVSPHLAKDLGGLPSTLVLTAGSDPMRDEGEDFARRAQASGSEVEAIRFPGTVHGFFLMNGVLEDGEPAINEVARWLILRR